MQRWRDQLRCTKQVPPAARRLEHNLSASARLSVAIEPRKCRSGPGRSNHLLYEVLIEPRHGAVGRPQNEPPHRYAVDFTLKKKLLHRPPSVRPGGRTPTTLTRRLLGDRRDARHSRAGTHGLSRKKPRIARGKRHRGNRMRPVL